MQMLLPTKLAGHPWLLFGFALACMYVCALRAWKRASDHPGPELQMVVSQDVGAEN